MHFMKNPPRVSAANNDTSPLIRNVKSSMRRILIGFLLLAIVLLLIIGTILYRHSSNECTSEECERSAKDLQKNMDRSVNPCEDFYSYVCGAEVDDVEDHSRPKRHLDYKPYDRDEEAYKAFLRQNDWKINALKMMPKFLKQFGLPTVPKLLNQNETSSWSNFSFDWVRSVAQIKRALGFNVFVRFDVVENRDRNRLTLGCNNVDVLSTMSTDAEEFARDLQELVQLINPAIHLVYDKSNFFTEVEAFLAFRKNLPVVDDKAAGEDPGYYTAAELQNITNSSHPVWQPYLDVLFADLPSVKPAVNEKLQIEPGNLKCMNNLVSFLSKQPPAIVELYVWLAVTVHSIDNWEFLDKTKPRVEQMFNGIRSTFQKVILQTDWMDSTSKNASINRSQEMSSLIGFPNWILNFDTLKEHYRQLQTDDVHVLENWVGAQKLLNSIKLQFWEVRNHTIGNRDVPDNDVYYLRKYKVIKIPRTVISYPDYNRGLEALNYGRLGVTVGNYMVVGLNGLGNDQQVWSNETLQEYNDRISYLANQINGSSLTVQREYVIEIGGLRAAIGAYRAYVQQNGPEQFLPRFNKFSHDQLFFISYGNKFCQRSKDKANRSKIRLQKILSNMQEFSEVFKCPNGSAMNPEKKYSIW